jgi:hypothetical protein
MLFFTHDLLLLYSPSPIFFSLFFFGTHRLQQNITLLAPTAFWRSTNLSDFSPTFFFLSSCFCSLTMENHYSFRMEGFLALYKGCGPEVCGGGRGGVCVYVDGWVCMKKRDRQRQTDRDRQRDRQTSEREREREKGCCPEVCV